MGSVKKPYRALKICCIVTAILLIILVLVFVILYFTLLKPKQPTITTRSVTLESVKLIVVPIHINVSLGLTFTIDNPNYGSFKYDNSTAYVTYRGDAVAEAAIQHDTLPARGKLDVGTTVEVIGDKLVFNPNFLADYFSGCFNFTSSTRLHGRVTVLKMFKMSATSFSTCDISVFFLTRNATSVCRSKVKY